MDLFLFCRCENCHASQTERGKFFMQDLWSEENESLLDFWLLQGTFGPTVPQKMIVNSYKNVKKPKNVKEWESDQKQAHFHKYQSPET